MQLLRRYDQYRYYRTRSPGALAILGGDSKFLGKRIFYHFSDMLVQKQRHFQYCGPFNMVGPLCLDCW